MRLRKRSKRRPFSVRPLQPWVFAAGLLVSFTATAGIRTMVDPSTPGLRFSEDPVQVGLAWPTLTAPDIAVMHEDFFAPRLSPQINSADTEDDAEPQLSPGLWRSAQITDSAEPLSEATPEISVLFRLGGDIMPSARTFAADDGGPAVGSFSGLKPVPVAIALAPQTVSPGVVPAREQGIVVAKAAPLPVSVPLPKEQESVKISLPASRPVQPKSPLVGVVKNERELRCLAEAIYFESRSEPERGQAGVAQVVLNRVKSGVYPSTVCGVVYQNRHRYLACQFTFACEGKALRTDESGPWSTAQRIARDVAEGRTYLPGVGNATHYHANYVRPWWTRYMDRREKVGKHIFYFEAAEN